MNMGRFGLAMFFALLVATAAVQAQDTTLTERFVRAFQHYCIDIDLERTRAELTAKLGRPDDIRSSDGVHTRTHQTWTEQGDPHDRLIFGIWQTDGVPRSCGVTATWGEKSEIISKLSASVALANATTWVEHNAEVTRWTARARGVPVLIKLRVPTYINEPGRILTLLMDRAEIMSKEELQKYYTLDDLETHQRTDGR
jgi:hypothetical protein